MNYRPDIDGLRAIAIISVMVFHVNATILPGGFIGVDVFFVLSGFLITGVLLKEYKSNFRIDLINFYNRRIKRILPSLFLVIFVTWLIGFFILLPDDFVGLAKSIKYVMMFISNWYFARKGDYFSPDSEELPLLHTWSLAIEEQFYFLWPLSLLLIFKLKKNNLRWLSMVAVCLLSFILAQFLSLNVTTKKISYFLPFTRFGELLLGCMVAYGFNFHSNFQIQKKSISNLLVVIGFVLVVLPFWLVSEETIFPGIYSFFPSLGAALIIWIGGSRPHLLSPFLSSKPMVYIGQHSYALYLWHWPVLAYYRYVSGDTILSWWSALFCVSITVILSIVSRNLFENPIYHSKLNFKNSFYKILLLPVVILSLLVVITTSTKGLGFRVPKLAALNEVNNYLSLNFCHNTQRQDCDLHKSNGANFQFLLLGDSHAGHYSPFWKEIVSSTSFNLYAKSVDSCPTLLQVDESTKETIRNFSSNLCIEYLIEMLAKISEFDIVILAGNWAAYEKNIPNFYKRLKETILFLQQQQKTVIVMAMIPEINRKEYFKAVRFEFAPFTKWIGEEKLKISQTLEVRKTNEKLKSYMNQSVIWLDIKDLDFQVSEKLPIFENKLVYKDEDHLNENGSILLGKYFTQKVLQRLCKNHLCSN